MLKRLMLLALFTSPALADVPGAVTGQILPGYAGFTEATAALATAALADCTPGALRPAYDAAFDAWLRVAHLRIGPVEEEGRVLAIAFWPDPKGTGAKVLATLIRDEDPAVNDPAAFAQVSVAGRGLFALERLLYDPALTGPYPCALTRAVAADLARMARETEAGWTNGFADLLLTAGQPGNPRFLTDTEARQTLFTQLMTGLEFNADQRLGRPLGTFDRPRPERAEARLSGRSQRNLVQSLTALRDLARALAPDSPKTDAGFAKAIDLAEALNDPTLQGVADSTGHLKAEILQQTLRATRDAARGEVGGALGVAMGFNSADGD